jgi:tetratricopeptide (TPR) repeat protein
MRWVLPLLIVAVVSSHAPAGLHYSGETFAELPSRWNGFLIDQRMLRRTAVARPDGQPISPLRDPYLAAAAKLEQVAKSRPLTADEAADLGALYVRLGKPERAVEVLRPAARANPDHFRLAANLGTAWQLAGDLEQAAAALEEAVRLAPENLREFESYHLKLVRLRMKEGRAALNPTTVDGLFGAKPPANAVAVVQYLGLSLPADGRLLWQLGELAFAHGEVRTAAAILDGCVTEFAMGAPLLREHRKAYRAAADVLAKKPDHESHKATFVAKSPRPLARRFDTSTLPPIRADRANPLPWGLLAETTIGPKVSRDFPKHLESLDGKTVTITGFIQPIGDGPELSRLLLLEFPVGCWFCETPEPTGLVSVELEPGKRIAAKKGLVRVTGTFALNRDDPEDFLFCIRDAKVSDPE